MKKLLVAILVLVLVGGLIWWLKKKPAAGADEEEAKPTAAVQVAPLQSESISRTLPAVGIVEAAPSGVHTLTVGYDLIVKEVAVGLGARVEAGQRLMTVDPSPDAKLQVDSARSAEALAQRTLAAVRQRYDLKLATGDDLRTAQQGAEDSKLKLASYLRRGMAGSSEVKAPAAGIVTKLDPQGGQFVPAGTALAVVSDQSHLQARLSVEASDGAGVKPGQKVTLTSINRPDAEPVEAAVTSVGSNLDPATGTADVRVALPDAASWFAGERVQGQIELEKKTALVAPRSAVLPDDEQQVLYTVKDHKAAKHVVQVGISSADKVEVSAKDIQAGDSVVTQGNYELEDGMSVSLPGEGEKADKADAKDSDEKAAAPAAKDGKDAKDSDEKAAKPEDKTSKDAQAGKDAKAEAKP